MTAEIPDAVLSENSLAHAIESGSITPGDLGSLASHLDALVASNVASTQLMVDRHHNTAVAELYTLSHQSEQEAHRLLQPFVSAYHQSSERGSDLDAYAMVYPAHIARIAVTGSPWDYPVCFRHLVNASTRCYQQLREALAHTGAFTDNQLAHFDYFGHVDSAEIQTIDTLLATAPPKALTPALGLAKHLAVFEDLFWQRMLTLCTPSPAA
ncbi:hypothetical protein SAMN04487849_109111 [Micrococcus luteus]|uniref:Thiaminase-2/PQQC domain-containing protein n=1 Tax=Micrococcus luteus TaxID=1270 RepID=A0ABD7M990_MICLU|nr:hypothetical protein [Micrococcus luteus]SHL73770.1 hypothetical protein SAMN04487849_109111 [Micrococcus luteus]